MQLSIRRAIVAAALVVTVAACDDDVAGPEQPRVFDPDVAAVVTVDRFSDDAGNLFRRSGNAALPGPDVPIDFDQSPFITQGLGPAGQVVRYYNFDVQPAAPAPIFVLFREGGSAPVDGQLNIIDAIPGDTGYNDFWQVMRVTVPADYVANTVASLDGILAAGYPVEALDAVVNCPVVPEGSVAREGPGANGLVRGWYKDQVVFYFEFDEAPLATTVSSTVPTSPIFVSFNVNPDQPDGGPATGFVTQRGSSQTHNVVATLPGDPTYSPLWDVIPFDNAAFDTVLDLGSAESAPNFGVAAQVNCPVVFVGSVPGDPATAPRTVVDRFSDEAGNLFRRSGNASLPEAGEAIDFDASFLTTGFGPAGQVVRYYNFDVMPEAPAPIFAFAYPDGTPVPGQLNLIDVVPGDGGYSDFWQVVMVTVPDEYIANTVTSVSDLIAAGYETTSTDIIVNCPVVPDGSTAALRLGGGDTGLVQGWYQGEVVYYFAFGEAAVTTTDTGSVPTSPIYVTFNINPDEELGGPQSGFRVETGTDQTHNVVETLPGDAGYSPLWAVFPYDNAEFDQVLDLPSAQTATSFGLAALVNCPVVALP